VVLSNFPDFNFFTKENQRHKDIFVTFIRKYNSNIFEEKISRFLHELLGWHEQYPNDTQLQSRFAPAYLV
jgi:hypothetical protein